MSDSCACFRLYEKLEADGKGRKTIKAQHLWFRILEAQMETGDGGGGPGWAVAFFFHDSTWQNETWGFYRSSFMLVGSKIRGIPLALAILTEKIMINNEILG